MKKLTGNIVFYSQIKTLVKISCDDVELAACTSIDKRFLENPTNKEKRFKNEIAL